MWQRPRLGAALAGRGSRAHDDLAGSGLSRGRLWLAAGLSDIQRHSGRRLRRGDRDHHGWLGGSFDWGQNADFQVRYDLLFGDFSGSNPFSWGIASGNLAALVPSQGFTGDCGGADSNCPGPGASPPYFGEVGGLYSFSRTWQVSYFGGPSPERLLFVALEASANNGAWGEIDHERLTVTVNSPTVTFTSMSGNPYTVPEPSSGDVLAGSILVALARWRSGASRTAAVASERRGARGPDDE